MAHIHVRCLKKTYQIPVREAGLVSSVRSLFHRRYTAVEAVQDVSFDIQPGEVVGFIGPNGAGKTTTLKILSGLLHPTQGEVRVAGEIPWERKPDYLRQISMVIGNRSQMTWDIPPLDTYAVLAEIYRVPPRELHSRMDELAAMLDIRDLLTKPVRNLSLGERMKCELVASLLHHPAVLFLDEPTLGLDVSTQRRLREFIRDYNRRTGATIILTSHYMADVEALCSRLMVIHHGRLIYDGALTGLVQQLAPFKLIRLTLNGGCSGIPDELTSHVTVTEQDDDGHLTLRTSRDQVAAITARLLETLPVVDLAVEEPPIEAVIDQFYTEGAQP